MATHFHDLKNGVLPKLTNFAQLLKNAKLDESIQNEEIEIEGYTLDRSARN